MFQSHAGEFAALLTAVFWTATALAFESAARKVGSLSVNLFRLYIAIILLSIFTWIYRGQVFPSDATTHQWIWLPVSGLIGFVFGDYFLFKSYTLITSRISMLIMTLVPPITAVIGYVFLGEHMTLLHILGMTLTISGIGLAIFTRNGGTKKMQFNYSLKGLFFAFLGALGQAVGLVMSKYGMQDYDPFAASQIRVMAGIIGFTVIVFMLGKQHIIRTTIKNRKAMTGIFTGSFFGPFLGVSFSLLAVQLTATGIASTLMAIVPVLIIPPSILFFKHKVTLLELIGAVISVVGVVLFFIK